MKTFNFDLEEKEYSNPCNSLYIDEKCNGIVTMILLRESSFFSEAAKEIVDESIHIDPVVLEFMYDINIQEIEESAIRECDLNSENDEGFDFARDGVFSFYDEQLHTNADAIAQNALISYVNDMTITSNVNYDHKEIESFIVSYIKDISIDTNDRLDSVINDFESELLSKFDIEIMEVTK